MRYIFNEQFYSIENVRVELYDSSGKFYSISMEYNELYNQWELESHIEVTRYKYVINDVIRLNDPATNQYVYDEKWEVWSVPNRDTLNTPYLSDYNISSGLANGVNGSIRKTEYVYDRPIDVYIGVDICKVKGLHTLTYICFQPNGMIYMIEESSMGQFEQSEADYEVVFKNRIKNIQGRYAEGMWTYQVYLDGKRIIKDYFVVKRKIISDLVLFDCKM